LFFNQKLQIVFIIQNLLKVNFDGVNDFLVLFVTLLVGFVLLSKRCKLIMKLVVLCAQGRQLFI